MAGVQLDARVAAAEERLHELLAEIEQLRDYAMPRDDATRILLELAEKVEGMEADDSVARLEQKHSQMEQQLAQHFGSSDKQLHHLEARADSAEQGQREIHQQLTGQMDELGDYAMPREDATRILLELAEKVQGLEADNPVARLEQQQAEHSQSTDKQLDRLTARIDSAEQEQREMHQQLTGRVDSLELDVRAAAVAMPLALEKLELEQVQCSQRVDEVDTYLVYPKELASRLEAAEAMISDHSRQREPETGASVEQRLAEFHRRLLACELAAQEVT
jgi:hypothetical protein